MSTRGITCRNGGRRSRARPAAVRATAFFAFAVIGLGEPPPAFSQPGPTLWSDGEERTLKAILQLDSAIFWEHDAWLGESNANAGGHVGSWSEWAT